ncbi:hypothetical protein IC006_0524 [Sulfuracidifex tepidarius]|uniref:Uncharacterized protein n=1 Tax=Sulfuracidifex tepidarius TaxID=1294262 RepID=A0A510DSX6_9CREN|nr:hypothetical protein [Sulfuracidifex tepidarius]BBG23240.1 hypothetical protein IC006_0524 [Sulfuracidifex tepidarius]BBG25990.1 hypothetical protein IC007_0495 [Sulfuracidifex tepidarius]
MINIKNIISVILILISLISINSFIQVLIGTSNGISGQPSQNIGYVKYTLDLWNNSLLYGNTSGKEPNFPSHFIYVSTGYIYILTCDSVDILVNSPRPYGRGIPTSRWRFPASQRNLDPPSPTAEVPSNGTVL